MTPQEVLAQYKDLAAKAGDAYLSLEDARDRVRSLEASLDALRAEKRALEGKYAEAIKAGEKADAVATEAVAAD